MSAPEGERRAAAELVFRYLAATDPLPAAPADAVLGFGMFDLKLARFCGELYVRGLARRIVFMGGLGAGTGDLGMPEADAWRAELRRAHPHIPPQDVITENRSTNTAENVAFTAALLAREHPALAFGGGLQTALVVASPSRLRRAALTLRHLQPDVRIFRQLPRVSFDEEQALYARNGIDYLVHLAGELDRIVRYPALGWIAAEPLPSAIAEAHAQLRSAGNHMP
jgi:uncharacterized SAM-binding protein YcdF (DUF218 family)